MRRLATGLGCLLLLALAALWLGPRAMDWEPWRGRLAEIATDRLGRPVTLDGPVELELLPSPVVRAGGVTIGEPDGEGEGFRVTARVLRLRLDLPALIAGRLAPRELALVGAELTLPWPPGPLLAFRPPSWITELDAQVEDGRVRLGDTVLEGVTARLASGGPAQALDIAGSFQWGGRVARFAATLGRPGWDGIAPVELSLTMPEAAGTARGVLVPNGGFEGRMEASGPDLAALLPSPPGAFRAAGRLTATAELIAADDLTLDLAGAPARGTAALRLAPAPRLDIALLASRVDLDGWVAALRGAPARPWPVSVDLSAEAAAFAGLTLRRLRGAAFLEEGRLTLTDVSVLLPGETELEFAGATAGGRLEVGARFAGPDIRATLGTLGLPVEELDPALLRRGEGRFRLVLEESLASVPELTASFEGLRLSGAGTLRHGARPALGLGLTFDRLDLRRWLPNGIDPAAATRALGGLDVNLRLAADRASWGEVALDRAALDAAVEGGRVTLRRLSGRLAEADIVASATATLGPQLRLADVMLEANGPAARAARPGARRLARRHRARRHAGHAAPDWRRRPGGAGAARRGAARRAARRGERHAGPAGPPRRRGGDPAPPRRTPAARGGVRRGCRVLARGRVLLAGRERHGRAAGQRGRELRDRRRRAARRWRAGAGGRPAAAPDRAHRGGAPAGAAARPAQHGAPGCHAARRLGRRACAGGRRDRGGRHRAGKRLRRRFAWPMRGCGSTGCGRDWPAAPWKAWSGSTWMAGAAAHRARRAAGGGDAGRAPARPALRPVGRAGRGLGGALRRSGMRRPRCSARVRHLARGAARRGADRLDLIAAAAATGLADPPRPRPGARRGPDHRRERLRAAGAGGQRGGGGSSASGPAVSRRKAVPQRR
jgi:hypothetical protein